MHQATLESGLNYLAHHGVKGMKWGKRRSKGSDGKVVSVSDTGRKAADGLPIYDVGVKVSKRSKASHLSDDELRRAINRLDMEKRYNDLTREPAKVSRGKKIVDGVMKVGIDSLRNAGQQVLTKQIATRLNAQLASNVSVSSINTKINLKDIPDFT